MGTEISLNIVFELRDKYLYCKIVEDITINNYERIFQEILKQANNNKQNRILMDVHKTKFLANIMNRFDIGKFMAEKARAEYKIAALAHEDQLKEALVETVARNRGLNFYTFLNEKEAVDWLLK